MTHILLPSTEQHRLVFYLAMEEYLCETPHEDMLFLWQSRPTVIFGRHQSMEDEVNIPWCKEHGVEMYRRKSGGGCVYSDEGNLMISYITPRTDPQEVFNNYLSTLSNVLGTLQLDAVSTANNDILIGGTKVSGNACFAGKNGTIVHGTLLWKSNIDNLSSAITPSREKLEKHAVKSVRQRVGNLYDMGITDLEELKQHIIHLLCQHERTLSETEINQIRTIEQTYLDPSFIHRR